MVSSNSQLGVTLVAVDHISNTLNKVKKNTKETADEMKKVAKTTDGLGKAFGSFGARLKTAFQMHVINHGLGLLDRALRRVADALPDLIARGEKWAHTVDQIGDITGMTARQASELAAVAENVTVSSDGLGRMMNALARSVKATPELFRMNGIAIRDNNKQMLDAYSIFQNTRARISKLGSSLETAALAQKIFGRASLEAMDILTLSTRAYRAQAEEARKSGLILTEAGLHAADEWERTKLRMDQAITGVGAQLLNALAPTFIGLTNGITDLIQKNLSQIVNFVSGAVSFVAGMVSQFLGIEFNIELPKDIKDVGDEADQTGKKLTKGAKGTKDAVAAYDRAAASAKALAEAEKALAAARSETIFGANMSVADMVLANQAKQARIKDAEERVRDARKNASQHRETMGEIARVNEQSLTRMGRSWKSYSGESGPVVTGLSETLASSKAFGKQIADTIQDAIFGPDQQIQLGGGAPISIRSGGLVGALQDAGALMATVGGHLSNLNTLVGPAGPIVLGLLGLKLALGVSGIGAAGAVAGGVGSAIGAIGGAPAVAAIAAAMVPALWYAAAGGKYRPDRVAGAPGTNISSDRPQGPPNVHGTAASRARHARWALLQRAAQQSSPWLHRDPAEPWIPASPAEGPMPGPAPGAGIGNLAATSGLDAYGTLMDNIYRRYSGDGSMMLEAASSTASSLTSLVVSVPEALDSLVTNQNLATQDIGAMWASIGEQGLELRDMGNAARAAKEVADQALASAADAHSRITANKSAQSSLNYVYSQGISNLDSGLGSLSSTVDANKAAQSSLNYVYSQGISNLGTTVAANKAGQNAINEVYSAYISHYGYLITANKAAQGVLNDVYSQGISNLGTSFDANKAAQGTLNDVYSQGISGINNYLGWKGPVWDATREIATEASGKADKAKDRAEDANRYAGSAYDRANGAHNRLDDHSQHISNLWSKVWGKLEINSFKAFKGAQKVLDSVQNKRLNALESSGSDKSETWSAMSAVSSADGLARGGYAPPGWTGWVGEKGPELMRVGSRGVNVTDAQRSARMAGGAPITVNVVLDGRTIARAMTSSDVQTSTLKPG